jgi:hypothetical protein
LCRLILFQIPKKSLTNPWSTTGDSCHSEIRMPNSKSNNYL